MLNLQASSDTCLVVLAIKSIFPGDVLWVRDSEIFENRDIAGAVENMMCQIISERPMMFLMVLSVFRLCVSDEISEQNGDILQVEEGFRGTLLTSSVSAQLCQGITFSK